MPDSPLTVLSIVIPTIVGVAAIVAPLYRKVYAIESGDKAAAGDREKLEADISKVQDTVGGVSDDLGEIREEVHANAMQAETNQRHIHQLLVGKIDDDDNDIGNPHYKAEHCPLPDNCPFHSEAE